ncbi:zinc ribbon domain-containing protein [Methanococcoides sp.]|uniref:zinc ribbon domain-containing protein n=1 Tax=Methanococcoides sp. TaxID=1966350 RepID=UPI00272EE838|nr:zinc ribbon domain-containing protein [Methanococcoides sp.]
MEKKTKGLDEIYCRSCGEIIKNEAEICPHCGVRNSYSMTNSKNIPKGSNYNLLLPILYISGLICFLSARFSSNIMVTVFSNMIFVAIFIASIIIVYSDANNLDASKSEKWVIVISVLLLWIFILPAYIFKRKSLQNYEAK